MSTNMNSIFEFLYFEDMSLFFSYVLYEYFNFDGSRNSESKQYTLRNDYEYFENFVISLTYIYLESRGDESNYLDLNVQLYGFLINYDFK